MIGDALQTVVDRGDFLRSLPDEGPAGAQAGAEQAPIEADPALVVEFIERSRASLAALERDIRTRSGPELFDFIREDIGELRRVLFDPRSLQVIMAGMEATWWLNSRLQEWLGEKNVADTLTQSVPHNVTSEMGLALLDVADVMRPHPDVVTFLQQVEHDGVRRRRLPRRARHGCGRPRGSGRLPSLPRRVRHALPRRDRHHEAALERATRHTRVHDPRQHQQP